MKLCVFGSRTFTDTDLAMEVINNIIETLGWDVTEEVCGEADGADCLGKLWAEYLDIPVASFPANWNRQPDGSFDREAGFKRNQKMAEYCDCGIALWDGRSRGAMDMLSRLNLLAIPCAVYNQVTNEITFYDLGGEQ